MRFRSAAIAPSDEFLLMRSKWELFIDDRYSRRSDGIHWNAAVLSHRWAMILVRYDRHSNRAFTEGRRTSPSEDRRRLKWKSVARTSDGEVSRVGILCSMRQSICTCRSPPISTFKRRICCQGGPRARSSATRQDTEPDVIESVIGSNIHALTSQYTDCDEPVLAGNDVEASVDY